MLEYKNGYFVLVKKDTKIECFFFCINYGCWINFLKIKKSRRRKMNYVNEEIIIFSIAQANACLHANYISYISISSLISYVRSIIASNPSSHTFFLLVMNVER